MIDRLRWVHACALAVLAALFVVHAYGQTIAPTNSAPNPYRAIENWGELPEGRGWGSTSGVDVIPTEGASGSPSAAARSRRLR